jgi:pimeloyl-ACP methyl ester carboxylesterase
MGMIFKTKMVKEELTRLSDSILRDSKNNYSESVVQTSYGDTNIVSFMTDPAKESLIILHGGSGNAAITAWLFEDLADKFNLIIPDIIGGTGKSEENFLNPETDEYGEWLEELLVELNLSKVNIMAISQGSYPALRHLELGKSKIDKVVLYVPAAFVSPRLISTILKFFTPLMLLRVFKHNKLYQFIEKNIFTLTPNEKISKYFKYTFENTSFDMRQPKMIMEQCPSKETQALVISAENDLFFDGQKLQKRAAKYFGKSAKTVFLKKCNHSLTKSDKEFSSLLTKISEFI